MTYLDLVLSGLFRGLASVLPIDALALLGLPATGPTPDPAVQSVLTTAFALGSLAAILAALFSDTAQLSRGFWKAVKRRPDHATRLLLMLALASLPSLIVDLLPAPYAPHWNPIVSAALVIAFGVVLGAADHLGVTVRDMDHLSITHYSIIGVVKAALCFAGLAPQDAVIVLTRLFGCERDQSARLSLLLMIAPLLTQAVIAGHAAAISPVRAPLLDMAVVGVCSFVASLLAIAVLLAWLKNHGFFIFALAHLGVAGWILRGVFWP